MLPTYKQPCHKNSVNKNGASKDIIYEGQLDFDMTADEIRHYER